MADSVSLIAKMEVRLRDLEKQLAKAGQMADKGVKNIEKKFASMNPKFSSGFMAGFGGAIAGIVSTRTLSAIGEAVKSLADLADAAERLGVSTDYLQEFQHAVEMSGGTAEDAITGLEKFAKGLSEAGRGAGDLAAVLQANGVSIRNAKGELISVSEALSKYAELVKNAKSPQDQLNLAAMAFGRSAGPALVNALRDGAAGLKESADEAHRLGTVIESDVVKRARELDDQFTTLSRSWGAFMQEIAVGVSSVALPALQEVLYIIKQIIGILPGQEVSTDTLKAQIKDMQAGAANAERTGIGGYLAENYRAEEQRLQEQLQAREDAAADIAREQQAQSSRLQMTLRKPGGTILPPKGRGGGGGGGGKTRRDMAAETIAALELELQKVNAVGAALTEIETKEEIINQLRHAGVDAMSAQGEKITELVTSIETARAAQEAYNESMQDFRNVAEAGMSTFVDDLMNGADAADALNDALKNMLNTISQIAQKTILDSIFGGGAGGGAGGFGSILAKFMGGGGGAPQFGTGNLYAKGTNYHPGGQAIVGEKGPELVNLPRGSQVIPNYALGAGWGGGSEMNVIINNNSSSSVSQSKQNTGNGVDLVVMIEDVVANSISTPGKKPNRALRTGFGLSPGLTRR